MTGRETAALVLVLALLGYVAVLMPPRTARLLVELRRRIAEDPTARYRFYLSYLRTAAAGVALAVVVVRVGGLGFAAVGAFWENEVTDRVVPLLILAAGSAILVLLVATAFARRLDPDAVSPLKQWSAWSSSSRTRSANARSGR